MSRSRHTEAQMIGALKQLEAGREAEDVAREVGVSKHAIYAWKARHNVFYRGQPPTRRASQIIATPTTMAPSPRNLYSAFSTFLRQEAVLPT
jgi:transposase-like protein